MVPSPPARKAMPRNRRILTLTIAVLIGLRVWSAADSSLWLDELHSLAHAAPPTVAAVCEHTHWDLHPPLFYLTLHFLGAFHLAGWLRVVPILASLATVLPLLAITRRSRSATAAGVALWAFATIPSFVHYGAELRSYAWLSLCTLGAAIAAFSTEGGTLRRAVWFAVVVAVGMLTNYLMAFVVLAIGLTRLLILPCRAPSGEPAGAEWRRMIPLPMLVLAGAVGGLAFLPWLLHYAPWMVRTPQEFVPPPSLKLDAGGSLWKELLEAPVRSLIPAIDSLGTPWSGLALGAGFVFALVTACAAIVWCWRRGRGEIARTPPLVFASLVFGAVLGALILAFSVWGWHRIHVRYLTPAAVFWPVLFGEWFGALPAGRPRRWMIGLLAAATLALGIAEAGGASREDVRGVVAAARRLGAGAQSAPIYTALLRQPPRFEHVTPYLAYAEDLGAIEPAAVPARGEPGFDRPLVVITRWYRDFDSSAELARAKQNVKLEPSRLYVRLREGRRVVQRIPVDGMMTVWLFEPAR